MFSTSPALSKEKFERTQENVNIVTLGGHGHGKTWLASQLSRLLAAQGDGVSHKTVEMIDHSSSERENRRSEHASHLELWRRGAGLRFTLADLPGHSSYLKNTVSMMSHADVGLLVISPELGVDDTTRLHAHLASHLGPGLIIPVIVPRPDTDEETLDLIRMEVSELEGVAELEIVSEESLISLLEKVENHDTLKEGIGKREKDKPLLMALEQVFTFETYIYTRKSYSSLKLGSFMTINLVLFTLGWKYSQQRHVLCGQSAARCDDHRRCSGSLLSGEVIKDQCQRDGDIQEGDGHPGSGGQGRSIHKNEAGNRSEERRSDL